MSGPVDVDPAPISTPTGPDLGGRFRGLWSVAVVAAVILAVGWLAIGGGSARSLVVTLLVIGVPAGAAATAVALAARLGR